MVTGELLTFHPRCKPFGVGKPFRVWRSTHRIDQEKGVAPAFRSLGSCLVSRGSFPPTLWLKRQGLPAHARSPLQARALPSPLQPQELAFIVVPPLISVKQIPSAPQWLCSRRRKLRLNLDRGFRSRLLCTLPLAKPFCILTAKLCEHTSPLVVKGRKAPGLSLWPLKVP